MCASVNCLSLFEYGRFSEGSKKHSWVAVKEGMERCVSIDTLNLVAMPKFHTFASQSAIST